MLVIHCASSLLRVGGDGTGEEHYEEEGNGGLDNEGMPPSLIILILCFTKLHCVLWLLYACYLNLVASVSIDTLP